MFLLPTNIWTPFSGADFVGEAYNIRLTINSTNIIVSKRNYGTTLKYNIVVEYTKTTD